MITYTIVFINIILIISLFLSLKNNRDLKIKLKAQKRINEIYNSNSQQSNLNVRELQIESFYKPEELNK